MHKLLAIISARHIRSVQTDPWKHQKKIFNKIIKKLSNTRFGRDHGLTTQSDLADFQSRVPIYHYEDYEARYIPLLQQNQKNILWGGKIYAFAKSSGTTSGEKLVPLYWPALLAQASTAFVSAYYFLHFIKDYGLFKKKIFHLYGLARKEKKNGVTYGYVGHLANSIVPTWLMRGKYPPPHINQAKSWQEKIETITSDIVQQDLAVMAGTPPWINSCLELFNNKHHTTFAKNFPHLKLYIHGGCAFEHYRSEFFKLLGPTQKVWTQEVYPASEGYIGFQDHWSETNKTAQQDLLLNVGHNIFFEFLPYHNGEYDTQKRLTAKDVEVGSTYTLVLTTIGSFISYVIGDNITITNKVPLRFRFAGRARQVINLVNEHMDYRTLNLIFSDLREHTPTLIYDYTVLPQIIEGKASYLWLVETDSTIDEKKFLQLIEEKSRARNPFYHSWRTANIMQQERLICLSKGALLSYLSVAEAVGQNKVPQVIMAPEKQAKLVTYIVSHGLSLFPTSC